MAKNRKAAGAKEPAKERLPDAGQLTQRDLIKRFNRIDGLIVDVVCDQRLTAGQTLTILKMVRESLNRYIKTEVGDVRRRNPGPRRKEQ
jgi:hypothetical protein